MAKYSDHSTIGGLVLSHRIRMIKQNANIIFIAGKIAFIIGFLTYFFIYYSIYLNLYPIEKQMVMCKNITKHIS